MTFSKSKEPLEVSATALREYISLSIEQYLLFDPFSDKILSYLGTYCDTRALPELEAFREVSVHEAQVKFLEPTLEVYQKTLDSYSYGKTLDSCTRACIGVFSLLMREWKEKGAPVLNLTFIFPLMRLMSGDLNSKEFTENYFSNAGRVTWGPTNSRDLAQALQSLDSWFSLLTVFVDAFNPQEAFTEAFEMLFPKIDAVGEGTGLTKENLEVLVKDLSIDGDTFVSKAIREISILKFLEGEDKCARAERFLTSLDNYSQNCLERLYYLSRSGAEGKMGGACFTIFLRVFNELIGLGSNCFRPWLRNGVTELQTHQKIFVQHTRGSITEDLRYLKKYYEPST